MKKLFLFLVLTACVLSCRTVHNDGYIEHHHTSNGADTLAAVSHVEKKDSSNYFHGVIDSLATELSSIQQKYHDLYVRDSINENTYRKDSVNVKDSAWVHVNPDGTFTYYKYTEKTYYTYQQFERFKQQIVKESAATIDSLIEKNEHLQAKYDSLSVYQSLIDSVSIYKSKIDSLSNVITEKEKVTIIKNSLWDKIRAILVLAGFLVFVLAAVYVYLKFFRR